MYIQIGGSKGWKDSETQALVTYLWSSPHITNPANQGSYYTPLYTIPFTRWFTPAFDDSILITSHTHYSDLYTIPYALYTTPFTPHPLNYAFTPYNL